MEVFFLSNNQNEIFLLSNFQNVVLLLSRHLDGRILVPPMCARLILGLGDSPSQANFVNNCTSEIRGSTKLFQEKVR